MGRRAMSQTERTRLWRERARHGLVGRTRAGFELLPPITLPAGNTITIIVGDCRDVLPTLGRASIDSTVTSPPYFALRDYGGGPKAIGLQPTVAGYAAHLVDVFRLVRPVLRDTGTAWLNLGDCFCTAPPGNAPNTTALSSGLPNSIANQEMRRAAQVLVDKTKLAGLKPKDLIGIPWEVAFALRDDGWYLRSEVIYSKPNPTPESTRDRPTLSHEQVFLLTKSPRYYWDAAAIRERNRNRCSVWTIPKQIVRGHSAVFPEALVERCILAGCPPGDTVLDPFGGIGTVGLVAGRLGRNAVLIELNRSYAELARQRIEDQTR